jgi:hypothetical protein
MPITRRDRDWSFHVVITGVDEVQAVVQSDQLRSVSWEKRGSRFTCRAPAAAIDEVRAGKAKAAAVALNAASVRTASERRTRAPEIECRILFHRRREFDADAVG